LILGNGAFKPNISAQVGTLYAPGDARRDRAYSIFYVGINLGALIAPLVCGTLGEELAWHYGFTAAGVGMTIAIFVYIRALPLLPPDHIHRASMMPDAKEPFARKDWLPILALLTLFVPASFFWATYEQQGNTMVLWADDHTDRYVNLLFWRGEIPVTWFQAFNPFLIILFTPFIIGLWARQAQRGSEPSTDHPGNRSQWTPDRRGEKLCRCKLRLLRRHRVQQLRHYLRHRSHENGERES